MTDRFMIPRAFVPFATLTAAVALAGCGVGGNPGYATQEQVDEIDERLAELEGGGESDHGAEAEAEPASDEEAAPAEEAPHWTYAEAEEWGEIAAEFETCGTGTEQSPIDLSTPLISQEHPPTPGYKPSAATVTDNGHTVQVDVADGGGMVIDDHEYALKQLHFHAPSEHTVNEEHSPLEIHFVHADPEGKLAVIGVMVVEGEADPGFDEILSLIPGKGERVDLPTAVDVSTFLPDELMAYRYPGSLTTPPCSEGVTWTVLAETITWSGDQIAAITSHFAEPNNRPVQDEGNREVLFALPE